jgi:hypothetical protein
LAKETLLQSQFQALLNAPSVDDIALVKNTSEALSLMVCRGGRVTKLFPTRFGRNSR